MKTVVDVHEASAKFSQLLEQVERGEEVVHRADELARTGGGASREDIQAVIRAARDLPGALADDDPSDGAG